MTKQRHLPRWPIYVISKGRFTPGTALTAGFLIDDEVPFKLVVEPQEAADYAAIFGEDRLLVLPFSNLGQGSIPARNWVWEHSVAAGDERHWIIDDNIRRIYRFFKGHRLPCASGPAFAAIETFVDRYTNIAIGGMNYKMFGRDGVLPPFFLNTHVYSNLLIRNDLPNRWRGRYNEDTDLCLQVLSDGWCIVSINAFLADKITTMTMKGGNTDELYVDDGRLIMARSLERMWPHVVSVSRRWGRPQHVVDWTKFDTQLILKDGVDLAALAGKTDNFGLKLKAVREVKSSELRELIDAS